MALARGVALSGSDNKDVDLLERSWSMVRTHAVALGVEQHHFDAALVELSSDESLGRFEKRRFEKQHFKKRRFEKHCAAFAALLSPTEVPPIDAPSYASFSSEICRQAARALDGNDPACALALSRARDVLEPLRFAPLEIAPVVDSLIYVTREIQSDAALAHREGLAARLLDCAERLDGSRGKEIERKFLLSKLPVFSDEVETFTLAQGYLPGSTIRERVRRTTGSAGSTFRRTIKAGRGVSRLEFEEPIDETLFQQLWPLTAGARVEKRRHVFFHDGLTWEIDEFVDRDLVLAEVELGSIDQEFSIPDVIRSVLVREVTPESGFVNLKLAR